MITSIDAILRRLRGSHVALLIALDDQLVLAVTANEPVDASVPFLPLSDIRAIADFVLAHAVAAGAAEALAMAAE